MHFNDLKISVPLAVAFRLENGKQTPGNALYLTLTEELQNCNTSFRRGGPEAVQASLGIILPS